MKYAASALILAMAGASAALAQAPLLAPSSVTPAQPAFVASFQPPSTTCDLQLFEPRLVALANPAEASSWSLTIDAPGFVNQQSGPVSGLNDRLKPVTRLFMGGIGVQSPFGGRVFGGSNTMPRPFYAQLNVYDLNGELVCQDVIDLPE